MLAVQSLPRPAAPSRCVPASGPGRRLAGARRTTAAGARPQRRAYALPEVKPEQQQQQGSGSPHKRIFDDLGGPEGLKAAVDIFYSKVLADSELEPFFASVDMQKQKKKQVQFMTYVFGGPGQYKGRSMAESHGDLVKFSGLRDHHFDKIKQYLGETLQEMGVKQEVIQHAAGVVESTRQEFGFPK